MFNIIQESLTCDPSFEGWTDILHKNISIKRPVSLKKIVLKEALKFEESLAKLASEKGLPFTPATVFKSEVIVMTGHQPTIYHSGIYEKNRLLSQFCNAQKVSGINIIIDSDIEDCGTIKYPVNNRISTLKLVNVPSLIAAQKIDTKSLPHLNYPDKLNTALEFYNKLTGTSVVLANTLVRSIFESDRSYLNLPLTTLCSHPETQSYFTSLLSNPKELFTKYNATLNHFRAANNVKNAANPFPNLREIDSSYELPFWIVNIETGERTVLTSSNLTSYVGTIVPRGALVTVFLRLVCSDLFIHGLGGAKYDKFTDEFIQQLSYGVPSFCTVTATRLLFSTERSKYEEAKVLKDKLSSIHSHLSDYLGTGFFTSQTERKLNELATNRTNLVQELNDKKKLGSDIREIAIKLRALDNEIKALINGDQNITSRLAEVNIDNSILETWYCREYPFFLHKTRYDRSL